MASATIAIPSATPPPDPAFPRYSLADLLHQLGDIPADRVRMHPLPGTATFEQLVEINERVKPTCEWVDGTLVEKPMGQRESALTFMIIGELYLYVKNHNPGMFLGPVGVLRILPDVARAPDVSFLPWASLPGGKQPPRTDKVPALVPALAIEVLCESNKKREMERKRGEYFQAGVKLLWEIDPLTRTAVVYTAVDRAVNVPPEGSLDGGTVLPGFQLRLQDLFDWADRQSPTT